MKKQTLTILSALALLGAAGTAAARCRTGAPPQPWATDDTSGPINFDLSPLTSNPVLGLVGRGVAEATRGVTNIRHVMNLTDCPVAIRKVEGRVVERKSIGPRGTLETNFWVPWADDAPTYKDHHMIISVDGKDMFWLWQDRHEIRFKVLPGYVVDGQRAPGVAQGGGDRVLAIAMGTDNKPVFMFARR